MKQVEKLGGECVGCGSKKNLELDHIDKTKKSFEVSRMLSVSLEKFWKEVEKCQVLCGDCHEDKSIIESGKKIAKGKHGTLSSYRYCHCEECRIAKNKYTIEYRKTHARVAKRITATAL